MGEAIRSSAKTPDIKKEKQVSQVQKGSFHHPASSSVEKILFLQRTIGNQAVQRFMNSGAIQTKAEPEPVAGPLTQAEVDTIVSSTILHELDRFQKIPIDVAGTIPLPKGQEGPPAPLTIRVHVQGAYFINKAAAIAYYRPLRRAANFPAIIRALRSRREVSLIEGESPRFAGRAVELGKATPEDVKKFVDEALSQEVILRYAIQTRQLRRGKQLVDLGQRRLQILIQRWVRHVGLGVDCSGFVLQAAIRAREAVRTVGTIAGILAEIFGQPTVPLPPDISHHERSAAQRGPRVQRPTDLRPGDVWVVSGGRHVRIISTVKMSTLRNGTVVIEFTTAESSGGSKQPLPGPVARTWRTRSLRAFNPITRVGHSKGDIGGTFHRFP